MTSQIVRINQGQEQIARLHFDCVQLGWIISFEDGDNTENRFRASRSASGISLSDGNTQLVEPSHAGLAFRRLGAELRASVLLTMANDQTAAIFEELHDWPAEIAVATAANQLPVLESFWDLAEMSPSLSDSCFACLCKQERVVVITVFAVDELISFASDISCRLDNMLRTRPSLRSTPKLASAPSSQARLVSNEPQAAPLSRLSSTSAEPRHIWHDAAYDRRANSRVPSCDGRGGVIPSSESSFSEKKGFDVTSEELFVYDPELETAKSVQRRMALTRSIASCIGILLIMLAQGSGMATLFEEMWWDGDKTRLALLIVVPFRVLFSLFFVNVLVGSAFQLLGPFSDIAGNTRFHSAKAPDVSRHHNTELPHITIHLPVYKEGLAGVIAPTIHSLLAACRYYQQRGGSASILVSEDGMQIISPELATARRTFYAENNIGWCARPGHNQEGYIRAGQFKKASNMNYSLNFSLRVEKVFLDLLEQRAAELNCSTDHLRDDEDRFYKQALGICLEQDSGETWASGNLRIGEVILIVDSDTRVPLTSLYLGALEMHESPDVAILQHVSGVMNVTQGAFENGIHYFTDLIYNSIKYAVGTGECCPFVGHNAFLRWRAIQEIAPAQADGTRKFWTDCHVSEDFEMSLRLQVAGSIVRLASYHGEEFKEGVSLTVFDEILRWQKYTYGCNELMVRPLRRWYKGPFTPLFREFIWTSSIKITSKLTIVAYIMTYYAIASALWLSLINYFMRGWVPYLIDKYYMDSFSLTLSIVLVFNIISPFAYAVVQTRMNNKSFIRSLLENIKYMPMFILFMSGLSLHLTKSIACHFFGIKAEWGSTAKEIEASGFFVGVDRIIKEYKWMYLFIFALIAGVLYLGLGAPSDWSIRDWSCIVPLGIQLLGHVLAPIFLGLT